MSEIPQNSEYLRHVREAFQWPNIQCWLGFMVYTKTNHEICPWAWYLNIRMVFGPASVILLLRVVSDFLRMGFDLEVWYAWLGFDFGSGEPTDTRVDDWNLAEISLVDPKFSLLRVKVSEISPSETRGISESDSFSWKSDNLGSMSGYFISQIQQVNSRCQLVLFFIPQQSWWDLTNIVSFDKHDGYFTNIVRFDKHDGIWPVSFDKHDGYFTNIVIFDKHDGICPETFYKRMSFDSGSGIIA